MRSHGKKYDTHVVLFEDYTTTSQRISEATNLWTKVRKVI